MDIERLKELGEDAHKEHTYHDSRFPPSMYYKFLRALARDVKPNLSVELGVCGGGGSLHLCLGHPEGQVIGVDLKADHVENIDHILENNSNFLFMLDDSVDAASYIKAGWGKIDIIFFDTDHLYDRTLQEYNAYLPLMSKGGIMCFDDLFRHHPDDDLSMEDAWDKIEGDKVRLDHLHDGTYPHGGGFGVVIV